MGNNCYLCISPKKTNDMKTFNFKVTHKRTYSNGELEVTAVRLCRNWDSVIFYLNHLSEAEDKNTKIEIKIENLNNDEE